MELTWYLTIRRPRSCHRLKCRRTCLCPQIRRADDIFVSLDRLQAKWGRDSFEKSRQGL